LLLSPAGQLLGGLHGLLDVRILLILLRHRTLANLLQELRGQTLGGLLGLLGSSGTLLALPLLLARLPDLLQLL
jgi:hypothetical protein